MTVSHHSIWKTVMALLPMLWLAAMPAFAQEADYERAQRFTSDELSKRTGSMWVSPNWIEDQDRFWYTFETSERNQWMYVNAPNQEQRPLFDHERMASELTEVFKEPFDRTDLPLEDFEYDTDQELFTFHVDSIRFTYDLDQQDLIKGDTLEPEKDEPWATYSPDSTYIAFAREHDLYLMETDDPDSTEYRLTEDGERWYSFQADHGDTTSGERLRSNARWFEDEVKLWVKRQDWRDVDELWVIDHLAEPRPELETYKYAMPGEEDIYKDELVVFDAEDRERVDIQIEERWPDQSVGGAYFNRGGIFTTDKSDALYYTKRDRTWEHIEVVRADTETGETETLIEETIRPYFNTRFMDLAIINEGEEYLWWSERDGWGHLYRYNSDGELQNRITEGHYNVGSIARIDTTGRTVYYEAFGRDEDMSPYYSQYYRVNFDGSGEQRLTFEDANHSFSMSDTDNYFVNNYSRPDRKPEAVLRNNQGEVIMELEEADLSGIEEIGWQMPERFTVKADDGMTDLYGVKWKPADFDPEEEYPIISYVYPGPQTESKPTRFTLSGASISPPALAQLGFVVIATGQRGGHPVRDKHYHTYGHDNLRDYPLADNKYTIEQLAGRHDYIDMDRVGIYGHSGGAFMSTAALLTYPDFYDVAVSSAGNHDNNIYNIWWSEVHHGVDQKTRTVTRETEDGEEEEVEETYFESHIPANTELAGNLEGRLLLVTGDIDSNVHPAGTIRMANALIEEGKKFDFMIMPGQRHGFGQYTPYFERMTWDYFVEHLLGETRDSVDYQLPD